MAFIANLRQDLNDDDSSVVNSSLGTCKLVRDNRAFICVAGSAGAGATAHKLTNTDC